MINNFTSYEFTQYLENNPNISIREICKIQNVKLLDIIYEMQQNSYYDSNRMKEISDCIKESIGIDKFNEELLYDVLFYSDPVDFLDFLKSYIEGLSIDTKDFLDHVDEIDDTKEDELAIVDRLIAYIADICGKDTVLNLLEKYTDKPDLLQFYEEIVRYPV